jgi:hypothetical protein
MQTISLKSLKCFGNQNLSLDNKNSYQHDALDNDNLTVQHGLAGSTKTETTTPLCSLE